jgi:cardiolipin synthase
MGLIKEAFSTIPNWISIFRMVMLIPLWIFAVEQRFTWLAWGLIFVALTDILDGLIARIFKQCSEIGATLDSWADHFIIISSVIWLFFFMEDLIPADRVIWLVPAIILFLISNLIGVIKNRQFGGTHILEGKILAVFGYLGIVLFLFERYSDMLLALLIGSWVIHSIVNIIFHFRPDLFNKHQRSLILGLLGKDYKEGPIRYFFS